MQHTDQYSNRNTARTTETHVVPPPRKLQAIGSKISCVATAGPLLHRLPRNTPRATEEQQDAEAGHQDRHANPDRSSGHSDLTDANRCVPESEQSLQRQQGSRDDDRQWPSP